MAKPSTKQELIDYCKRKLGAPVLEINVDDDQIDDLVDDAFQYFNERHFDGVERTYLKYKISQDDVDRGTASGTDQGTSTTLTRTSKTAAAENSITYGGTGGTHYTYIDFRAINKIYLIVTATMNDMNLIFPATSGNFLLNVRYDGDWDIDSWKVWKSDATAATGDNVFWPGGTEPATTAGGRDIFSFYWDADNEICYGVASLNFQEGN